MPMGVSDLERSSHIAYNVTFATKEVYEEYKQKVIAAGGTIKTDYGSILRVHQFIPIPQPILRPVSRGFPSSSPPLLLT